MNLKFISDTTSSFLLEKKTLKTWTRRSAKIQHSLLFQRQRKLDQAGQKGSRGPLHSLTLEKKCSNNRAYLVSKGGFEKIYSLPLHWF